MVRNCYVLPVDDLEQRLTYMEMPFYLPEHEREQAKRQSAVSAAKSNKVVNISHHLAHAYSGFAACPFDEGVVMVVDGVGGYRADVMEPFPADSDTVPLARESESYYRFSGTKLEPIKKVWLEPSRGFLSDEFYNMAGPRRALQPRLHLRLRRLEQVRRADGACALRPAARRQAVPANGKRRPESCAVARRVQSAVAHRNRQRPQVGGEPLDEALGGSGLADSGRHRTGPAWRAPNGCARPPAQRTSASPAASASIASPTAGSPAKSGFENVWIQPAAGDDGIAIGCAYYGHLAIQEKPRTHVIKHAFYGRPYREEEMEEAVNKRMVRLVSTATPSPDICKETAKILADGNIIGWFQGRSEFGPRALGNRSILADPRKAEMKDILNSRVKFRQPFRPFAPIVLKERADEIFLGPGSRPTC